MDRDSVPQSELVVSSFSHPEGISSWPGLVQLPAPTVIEGSGNAIELDPRSADGVARLSRGDSR